MIIEEIIAANTTAIILLLLLIFSRFITRRKRQTEDKFFNALLIIGICAAFFELISFLVDGKPGWFYKFMNYFSNTFIYSCTLTISLAWIWYADTMINRNLKRIKTVLLPFVIVWAILIIMLIINIFTGFVFRIDENNVYGRGDLQFLYYIYLFGSLIFTIILYFISRFKHGKTIFFPIHMFLVPILAACVIQALWYGIATSWLGCAIGLTAIYIDILSRQSLVDNLTHLSNRSYLEHSLRVVKEKSSRYAYGGMMCDVDYFKNINDTYGHSLGDEAIRNAARLLTESIDRNTYAFRFAGDEFIILVKLPIAKKNDLEAKLLEIKENINKNCEKFNNSGEKPYKINFSIGYAAYDPSLPDDEFFRRIDYAMYEEKKAHHSRR